MKLRTRWGTRRGLIINIRNRIKIEIEIEIEIKIKIKKKKIIAKKLSE